MSGKPLEECLDNELILNFGYITKEDLCDYNSIPYQMLEHNNKANQKDVKLFSMKEK